MSYKRVSACCGARRRSQRRPRRFRCEKRVMGRARFCPEAGVKCRRSGGGARLGIAGGDPEPAGTAQRRSTVRGPSSRSRTTRCTPSPTLATPRRGCRLSTGRAMITCASSAQLANGWRRRRRISSRWSRPTSRGLSVLAPKAGWNSLRHRQRCPPREAAVSFREGVLRPNAIVWVGPDAVVNWASCRSRTYVVSEPSCACILPKLDAPQNCPILRPHGESAGRGRQIALPPLKGPDLLYRHGAGRTVCLVRPSGRFP
jgi:hypothetical protein